MGRYWALWLASVMLKMAAFLSIIATIIMLTLNIYKADEMSVALGILVPQAKYTASGANNEIIATAVWAGRLFNGMLYASILFGMGQVCNLLIDMRRDTEATSIILHTRLGVKRPTPPTDPQVDWRTDAPPIRADYEATERRQRPPAPGVPDDNEDDDPRAPRPHRPRVWTSPIPENRAPRQGRKVPRIDPNDG